ncbi:GlxA family transcriptional regulator [Leisingera sp. ANG-Vp]|uniref:GlxA family transcriptional regulator n=1 Tax=Leisingera sp. ANG-Vp TaxID=1577896 RepID=UPI00068D96EA|nr:GlxA family transcriptional regulator [Leisingera sp. ANG-Vp]
MTTDYQSSGPKNSQPRFSGSAAADPFGLSSKRQNARHRFHFVLLPGFSLLSLVSALETLENANLCSGEALYDWVLCSIEAGPVASSLGMPAEAGQSLDDCRDPSDIVLVGGWQTKELESRKLSIWLSRHARGAVRVTGLATAAFVLADAGLLDKAPATLHWQFRDSFREMFPEVELSDRQFVSEGDRCTSSGGVSSIDLFLDLIAQDHGQAFAERVAESMNYGMIQEVQRTISAVAPVRTRVRNPKLAAVIGAMEQNLEEPQPPSVLAKQAGISARQLERLFRSQLNVTPKQYYMQLRLRRAYFLLTQTQMSVLDVALACGFQASSHFSKCFRNAYGTTPAQMQRGG